MNKYLMLSAAALMTTAVPAGANEPPNNSAVMIYLGSSSCGAIVHGGPKVFAVQWSACGGVGAIGQGLAAKTPGIGKNVNLSDDVEPLLGTNIGLSFDLQLPLKSGHKYGAWASFSGVTSFEFQSGTYDVGAPGHGGNVHHAIAAKLAELAGRRK